MAGEKTFEGVHFRWNAEKRRWETTSGVKIHIWPPDDGHRDWRLRVEEEGERNPIAHLPDSTKDGYMAFMCAAMKWKEYE